MALELRFTIPGQVERVVELNQPQMKLGALLSNQVVLRAPGVDPIHALIEQTDANQWYLTDLGSDTGVKLNGQLIDVEVQLNENDVISIGSVELKVFPVAVAASANEVPLPPPIPVAAGDEVRSAGHIPKASVPVPVITSSRRSETVKQPERSKSDEKRAEEKRPVLFSPRDARPSGDVLEVVAYWGDTVLDIDLFHPTYKDYSQVTIGNPAKSHLIAAGKTHFDSYTLASFSSKGGFKLHLKEGMSARLRKGGKVEKSVGPSAVSMGNRDIAHVKYGAVRYFMMMIRPPSIDLPKRKPADPFFMALTSIAMLLYLVLIPIVIMNAPEKKDELENDIWQFVNLPEKDQPPKKVEPIPNKEQIKVAEKKPEEPIKPPPPKPKPKPVKAAAPVEKEKVNQPKPVEKPVPEKRPTEMLTKNQNKPTANPSDQKQDKQDAKDAGPLNKLKGTGMASTGSKKPDFKLAGPKNKSPLGAAGGVKGSGMNQRGGAIKGTGKADYQGVEGVNNNKASGVNLSRLGLGPGKIINKVGAGAINTNFTNSAGGAGGGMGSASRTYGMGGVGNGKSMGIPGSGGAVNNFGSGAGGLLSGQGGSGGYGGAGISNAFGGGGGRGGRGRANVTLPPGDPVASGGLSPQEIMAVIRANLNQIRHCYEQLLQRSPSSQGKIGVQFIIGLSGRVETVSVSDSTISDSRMRGCVTGVIRRWPFPKPRGGQKVTVNYPFIFSPQN